MVRGPERHVPDSRRRGRRDRAGVACSPAAGTWNRPYDSRPATLAGGAAMARRGSAPASPRSPHSSPAFPARNPPANPRLPSETTFWTDGPRPRNVRTMRDDLGFLAPWIALPAAPNGLATTSAAADGIPTLRELAALERSCSGDERRRHAERRRRRALGSTQLAHTAAKRAVAPPSEWRRSNASCCRATRWPRMDYDFLLRQGAPPARHRIQRRRASLRCELLRPARLRGAALQLRRDRAGQAAAGELVCARAPADVGRRAIRSCCPGAARCSST